MTSTTTLTAPGKTFEVFYALAKYGRIEVQAEDYNEAHQLATESINQMALDSDDGSEDTVFGELLELLEYDPELDPDFEEDECNN